MIDIFIAIGALILGFVLLIWSADEFTENGAKIANIFNISPLVIGLVIFGFGTSAPEMFISGIAAINGNTDMGIGNVVGSNIFNITLILGISAMITPIYIDKQIIKKEWLFLLLVTICTGLLLADGYFGLIDGLALLISLISFLFYTIKTSKNNPEQETTQTQQIHSKNSKMWLMLIVALIVLIIGAQLVIWGGTNIAKAFNVSDLVISLSIFALGTSLPELAVAISSVMKKQYQMLVGNVIGSNLFNTAGVLAITGIINPYVVPQDIINRDYIFMFFITILFFVLAYRFNKRYVINRFGASILLAIFVYYVWQLFCK